jgi:hypothetical protein
MDKKGHRLEKYGYLPVTSWEQAKNYLESDYFIMMGGREIHDPIASFKTVGSKIDAELFEPAKMDMKHYMTSMDKVEMAFETAIEEGQPVYAKANEHGPGQKKLKPDMVKIYTYEEASDYLKKGKSLVVDLNDVIYFVTKVKDVVCMCCSDGRTSPMPEEAFKEMSGMLLDHGGYFIFDPGLKTTAYMLEYKPNGDA